MNRAFSFLALALFSTTAFAKSGVHDCQRQEAVQICVSDDGGSVLATYSGYLKGSGMPVAVRGEVNGSPFSSTLNDFKNGSDLFQLITIPRDARSHISIYFVDASGRFDSRFGANYQFDVKD